MKLIRSVPLNDYAAFEQFTIDNPKIMKENTSQYEPQAVDFLVVGDIESRTLALSCMEKLVLLGACRSHPPATSFVKGLRSRKEKSVEVFNTAFTALRDRCEAQARQGTAQRRERLPAAPIERHSRQTADVEAASTERHTRQNVDPTLIARLARQTPNADQTSAARHTPQTGTVDEATADRHSRQRAAVDSQARQERLPRDREISALEQQRETSVDSTHHINAIEPRTSSDRIARPAYYDRLPEPQGRQSSGQLADLPRDRHSQPPPSDYPRDSRERVADSTREKDQQRQQDTRYQEPRSRQLPERPAPHESILSTGRRPSEGTRGASSTSRRTTISSSVGLGRPRGVTEPDVRSHDSSREGAAVPYRPSRYQSAFGPLPESESPTVDSEAPRSENIRHRDNNPEPAGQPSGSSPPDGGYSSDPARFPSRRSDQSLSFRGGGAPHLDPEFRAIPTHRWDEYFCYGRVFAILEYAEDRRDPRNSGDGGGDQHSLRVTRDSFGHRIYTSVRRMVVVGRARGFCWAIPISTYNGRGLRKPGLSQTSIQAHAIIHMEGAPAQPLQNEPRSRKRPIEVRPEDRTQRLHPASRINFEKVHTVEMNVRVVKIGTVAERSLPFLHSYFDEERRRVAPESS